MRRNNTKVSDITLQEISVYADTSRNGNIAFSMVSVCSSGFEFGIYLYLTAYHIHPTSHVSLDAAEEWFLGDWETYFDHNWIWLYLMTGVFFTSVCFIGVWIVNSFYWLNDSLFLGIGSISWTNGFPWEICKTKRDVLLKMVLLIKYSFRFTFWWEGSCYGFIKTFEIVV